MNSVRRSYWVWTGLLVTVAIGCRTTPERRPEPAAVVVEPPVATSAAEVESEPLVRTVAHKQPNQTDPPPVPADIQPEMAVPLSLADVIATTLSTNPDLVSASAQIDAAEAALYRARAEFYPTLGISEEYGITNNPAQAFTFDLNQSQFSPFGDLNHPSARDDFHTQLTLRHNIYSGERRTHEIHAANGKRISAVYQLEAVQNRLVYHAAEAYYRLLQAHVLVAVREEAMQQVEQHLKIVQSRYRNGTAVKSDVLSVDVRLAEVREALISAKNQLQLAWSVLDNVVGMSFPRRPLPDEVDPAPWGDDIEMLESAIGEAQNRRPEVGVLSGQHQAANEGVRVAESGKRARADLVASYDVFTSEFKRGNDSYFLGLILQLNLFDGGRTAWDVEKAMARVRELRARQQRLLLDIELDVRRAHLALVSAKERLEVATQAIGLAQESLREIEVRYRGQAATITQLLDSQVALSNARVRRANAQAEVEIARASLQRAIGRLVDTMNE